VIRHRILSLDGSSVSGGEGFVGAGMLRALKTMIPANQTLLGKVDLIAGTSAGAFNALFFAMYENPDDGLDAAIEFWGDVVGTNRKGFSMLRVLRALAGQSAFLSSTPMKDFFISHFGANTRLGDLKRKVAIPSFMLDGKRKTVRSWKAKVFHNGGPPNNPDLEARVVDVAMRSGSGPLLWPIYQGIDETGSGYVDGGIYANNPGIVALAQCVRLLSVGDAPADAPIPFKAPSLEGILLLSMGNGYTSSYVAPNFCRGLADWGYSEWLLAIKDPFLLVKMMLESGVDATDYECRVLLARQYFRNNPLVDKPITANNLQQVEQAIEQILASPSTDQMLKNTTLWLDHSGWTDGEPDDHQLPQSPAP
jgi:uncharacterized protein